MFGGRSGTSISSRVSRLRTAFCTSLAAPPTAAVPRPMAFTIGTPLETAPGTGAGSFATAVVDVTSVSQSSSDSLSTTVSSKAIIFSCVLRVRALPRGPVL